MQKLRTLISLLRRQDGVSLVMAIGILGVLSISGTSLIYYADTNHRTAVYSRGNGSAYDLAEAGINEMMGVLTNPKNNALNQYLLPQTTHTYSTGTVTWSGTLTQSTSGASSWAITSTGKVRNTNSTDTTKMITRTLSAKVPVIPNYTQPLNNPAWNFIYSRATGSTCDMTLTSSVVVNSPLYVAGNLCLQNTSAIAKGPLIVHGSLTMSQSANYAGTSSVPLNQLHVKNGCKYRNNPLHNPCVQGDGSNSAYDNVWATTIDNTPTTTTPPTVDWDGWYANASPGPYYPCLTSSGTPPTFDTDAGSLPNVNLTKRNNSITTVQDLTPSSSYTCKTAAGELSWNASTHILTANGTIFIDGSAKINNGALDNLFRGEGTIYLSGTLLIKNSNLCQATTGTGSGMKCTSTGWDTTQNMLCFVAGGNGSAGAPQSQVPSGDSIQLVSANAQGALYATNAIDLGTTSNFDGPLDGGTVILGQSTSTTFPGFTFVPVGMPGNNEVYAQPQPPELYAG